MSAPAVEHSSTQKPHGAKLLRIIGVFKLLKGMALIAAGVSLLKLIHVDIVDLAQRWAARLHIAPGNKYLQDFLEKLPSLDKKKLVVAAAALFVYAAMFLTEGVGLCLLLPWAEWMTVITTIGLIPLEIYELIHRHGEGKSITLPALTLVVNVVIGVYLVVHVYRRTHQGRSSKPS